ncbi:MAG: hypothetical protein KJ063_25385 [Anaerolineae bacterium]|nr:hypothetical protein [Anaerolineae bacterium]
MNARFYSPTSGRFLTADIIMPGLTNPQAHNRYTYSFGNPLSWVDPTGHSPCSPDDNECHMGLVAADIHTLSGGMLLIHDLAAWTLAELRLILEAVQQIINGLQREAGTAEAARALLSSLIGGTAISLVRSGAEGLMGWNADERRIYIFDKGLQQSQAKITWDLAHEIGHVIETTWAAAAEFVQFTGGTYNETTASFLINELLWFEDDANRYAYSPGGLSGRAKNSRYESWSFNSRRHPSEDLAETIAFGILYGRGGGGSAPRAIGNNYHSYPGTVRMDYYQLIVDRVRGISP